MGGALFEGLIVSEAVKVLTNAGRRPDPPRRRSHDGLEVDLLLSTASGLVPIEIKSTATPTPRHAGVLDRFRHTVGDAAATNGLLVCRVKERRPLPGGHLALPGWELPDWLADRLGF